MFYVWKISQYAIYRNNKILVYLKFHWLDLVSYSRKIILGNFLLCVSVISLDCSDIHYAMCFEYEILFQSAVSIELKIIYK